MKDHFVSLTMTRYTLHEVSSKKSEFCDRLPFFFLYPRDDLLLFFSEKFH